MAYIGMGLNQVGGELKLNKQHKKGQFWQE